MRLNACAAATRCMKRSERDQLCSCSFSLCWSSKCDERSQFGSRLSFFCLTAVLSTVGLWSGYFFLCGCVLACVVHVICTCVCVCVCVSVCLSVCLSVCVSCVCLFPLTTETSVFRMFSVKQVVSLGGTELGPEKCENPQERSSVCDEPAMKNERAQSLAARNEFLQSAELHKDVKRNKRVLRNHDCDNCNRRLASIVTKRDFLSVTDTEAVVCDRQTHSCSHGNQYCHLIAKKSLFLSAMNRLFAQDGSFLVAQSIDACSIAVTVDAILRG